MSVHDPTSCSMAVLDVCPTTPSSGGQKRLGRASSDSLDLMGQPIIFANLCPNFGAWSSARGNADEIDVLGGSPADSLNAKTEHSGTKLPESARRVPESLPKRSTPVRDSATESRGGAA